MSQNFAQNSDLSLRPIQVRRELLKTQVMVARIARELESTTDWLLCARKAARLTSSTFNCLAILDLFTPEQGKLERVANAWAGEVSPVVLGNIQRNSWSAEARSDLENQLKAGRVIELKSGPALSEMEKLADAPAGELLVSVASLSYRNRPSGFLTLLRTEPMKPGSWPTLHSTSELAELIGNALGTRQSIENLRREISQRDLYFSAATHDLKVPLTTLMLQMDLLRLKLDSASSVNQLKESNSLDMLDQAIERLHESVQSLYDCSQLSNGSFKIRKVQTNLGQLVRNLLLIHDPSFRSGGNTLQPRLADNVIGFWDPTQISRVVTNLIQNAVKYAPRTLIEIGVRGLETHAEISIRDHGPGIEKSDQARVFESFYRTQTHRRSANEGLGLGLFICKGIVEAHEGTVSVRTPETGPGTEFIISLPYGTSSSKAGRSE